MRASKEELERLLDLKEVLSEIRDVEAAIREVDQKTGLSRARSELEKSVRRLEELYARRDELRRSVEALSSQADDARKRRRKIDEFLNRPATGPREAESAEAEIVSLSQAISRMEDEALLAIEKLEAIDEEIQHLETERREEMAHLTQLQEAVSERLSGLQEKKRQLEKRSTGLRRQVDPALLEAFEGAWMRYGSGAARVVNGRCASCHVAVPSSSLSALKAGDKEVNLVYCEQCGAILVP